jgi:hypothetical protein
VNQALLVAVLTKINLYALKRILQYRPFLFLVLLLGFLLVNGAVEAQRGDPDRALKTEKQKKKPKKKKQKDPDQSPRDRVLQQAQPPRQINHEPGAFVKKGKKQKQRSVSHEPGDFGEKKKPLLKNDEHYQPELVGDKGMTRKVKKGTLQEPGTHYTERSRKKGEKITDGQGTSSQGTISRKEKDINQPGKVYNAEDRVKAARKKRLPGTDHEGNMTVKRKEVDQPGKVYNHEERQKALKRQKLPGTSDPGNMTVKKRELVAPGTHHSERSEKNAQRYSSYKAARDAGRFTVKTRYVREPGVHWSERKSSFARQYKSTEAVSFGGNVRAMTKKQKTRHYGELSAKVSQHEGTIKLNRKLKPQMHPSVVASKAPAMRSYEQKDKARNHSRWINRIFKDKQQPKSVRAKDRKPHYDKKESEIWYD